MNSPTQRSLKYLRETGWDAEVVERWNSYARRRVDLFNCIDIVALRDGELAGVQTTSQSGSSRIAKIKDEKLMRAWLRAGGTLYVHGWAKRGPRGKRKVWTVRVVKITEDMLRAEDHVLHDANVEGAD